MPSRLSAIRGVPRRRRLTDGAAHLLLVSTRAHAQCDRRCRHLRLEVARPRARLVRLAALAHHLFPQMCTDSCCVTLLWILDKQIV
ncbi:hypothetical protein BDA96_07G066700 [Sorghum bicolor]|uniref:Uncharacterized protein n=2 Tax=Sorghum bicolor TaxID=4558 RepID=A0A921U9P2_SORBI|nr:hypothetical protein BDA96_07G066700 [Sorghum bicolor]KXG24596.1 hypothetical protein SORBI_3007G064100 [Sorghum bicolor]